MDKNDLKLRTKRFALKIIDFSNSIPLSKQGKVIEGQIIRSGTSVGSNYRSTCSSKSRRDFINKLSIVLEEIDETKYWLELLEESGTVPKETIAPIYDEASQIMAIIVASLKTAKLNGAKKQAVSA